LTLGEKKVHSDGGISGRRIWFFPQGTKKIIRRNNPTAMKSAKARSCGLSPAV
jgi:hypothetical protein